MKWVLLIFVAVIMTSCASYDVISEKNFAYLYDRSASTLHPEYSLHHIDDETTEVHYRLDNTELLYQRANGTSPFGARVRFSYRVYADLKNGSILDSGSTVVKDVTSHPDNPHHLIGSFKITSNRPLDHVIVMSATDLARDSKDSRLLKVTRSKSNDEDDFLLTDTAGVPLFTDRVAPGTQVMIYAPIQSGNTLQCRFYDRDFRLPPPAFTGYEAPKFDYVPDSIFSVVLDAEGHYKFTTRGSGFYHFQLKDEDKEGLTVFVRNSGFPEVANVVDMISPMRYITSMKEYDRLTADGSTKKNIEGFWIKCAGSKERAREVIKAYYERVENANHYFTSFVEGWRTDRGLIHVIFGMPNVIHKGEFSETWVYGEESNIMSLSFTFIKVKNPFTDNDFALDRDPLYKTSWYRSVESWRNGRVYN